MTDARDWQSDRGGDGIGRLRGPTDRRETAADPTDPEVPDAKRRRAHRRRQSVAVVATAVAGLVVIALLLLYRMGRQVTNAGGVTLRDDISAAAVSSVGGAPAPISATADPPAAPKVATQSTAAGTIGGPSARARPTPAPDIFRKPAF